MFLNNSAPFPRCVQFRAQHYTRMVEGRLKKRVELVDGTNKG